MGAKTKMTRIRFGHSFMKTQAKAWLPHDEDGKTVRASLPSINLSKSNAWFLCRSLATSRNDSVVARGKDCNEQPTDLQRPLLQESALF
jgi:hypothetical protein